MPHPARNHGLPKTVHPASMELAQLLALPRQTLVLLASAWHLVTTVSKARLAERIHAFEHTVLPPRGPIADVGVNSATPQHYCPLTWTNSPHHRPPFLKCRSRSCDRSISAAVHSERVGSPQLPVPVVESSALSPVTPQPPQPSRAIPTSTFSSMNNTTAVQDGSGLTPTPGPSLPPTNVVGTPGTSAHAHNLPPIPQKILQCIAKREYIDFADLLSDNLYPHPSLSGHPESIQIRGQPSRSLSIGHSSLASTQTVGGWSSLLVGGLECLSSNSPPLLPSPRP